MKHFSVTVLSAYVLIVALQACGGGGGGGSGSSGANGQPTAPGARTPTPAGSRPPATPTGSRTPGTPGTPGTTPLPTEPALPTPTPLRPEGNIHEALKNAPPGSTIVVAPGVYPALVVQAGDLQGPVTLLADITGNSEVIGAVTFDARHNSAAAISINGVNGLTLDGITAKGGTEEGIVVLDSPNTVIRNCIARNNAVDGVFVQNSDGSVLFDNLVFQNDAAGIRIYGSNDVTVFNNTLSANRSGIFVGTTSDPSTGVVLVNNIINGNSGTGVNVEAGNDVAGDYNLNTDGATSTAPVGAHDLDADPLFVSPTNGDFHLAPQQDDCTFGSPAINAGDPNTPVDFIASLQQRSTLEDNTPDCVGSLCCITLNASPTPQVVDLQPGQVDLGYHYAPPPATPTPKPRTPGHTKTPTRTPTSATPPPTPLPPTPTHTP